MCATVPNRACPKRYIERLVVGVAFSNGTLRAGDFKLMVYGDQTPFGCASARVSLRHDEALALVPVEAPPQAPSRGRTTALDL